MGQSNQFSGIDIYPTADCNCVDSPFGYLERLSDEAIHIAHSVSDTKFILAEPKMRFELTTYALRVRYSTLSYLGG